MSSTESDLAKWRLAQYRASVGLDGVEGGPRFRRLAEGFPAVSAQEGDPLPMTGDIRMSSFMQLRLRYPLGPEGYTCLAMEAASGKAAAHYAYAYWRRGHEAGDPEYVCVSPTFDSRDGEYRRRFIRYAVLADHHRREAEAYAPYEEAVLSLLGRGTLELRATVYPESARDAVADRATELRLAIVVFAAALALDLWEPAAGTQMLHTSGAYTALMTAMAGHLPELAARGEALSFVLMANGSDDYYSVWCGQKLVPMFAREAMQVRDYNLAAWRELAVAQQAGDLPLNFVSPAFAFYNQWSYIEGADAALFENAAMKERYARGLAVGEAARALREARRRLEAAAPGAHVEGLDSRIYESIEYAQSYLLVSPVAVLHTMEDVGVSLRSLATYARRSPRPVVGRLAGVFAELDGVARYAFDIAYGAHCLHTKLRAAHTDLHSNNMTHYVWGDFGDEFYSDPVVAYAAGPRGEADVYVFPASGVSGCLIDFSRCVLGPGFAFEGGRSEAYAEHFYRDQTHRAMRTLHRYAPAFVEKNEAALKAAVIANYSAVFPVLCAVDFIAAGRNIGAVLVDAAAAGDELERRPFRVSRQGIELVGRLELAAQELFIEGLQALVADPRHAPPAYPGDVLLPRVFGEWSYPRWAGRDPRRAAAAQLVDAYNHNNPLRYSGADYAKFPPWARLDEIERHLGEYRLTDLFERGVDPFLEALRPGARVEAIAERLRAEQERLDGRPAAADSSWLEE